jgi:hypothetical protein
MSANASLRSDLQYPRAAGHRGSLLLAATWLFFAGVATALDEPVRVTFEGEVSEHRWSLGEIDPQWPSDWSAYDYLVVEMRVSSPQRFAVWIHTADGKRRVMFHPFGQNIWLRTSIPLQYFRGRDQRGNDLASANNRRANSYWASTWGPFGDLKNVEALSVLMDYPLGSPTLEIRSVALMKEDPGSAFLEDEPVVDEFGQWVRGDWPRKIESRQQLQKELADERETFTDASEFGYCEYGGYRATQAKATGFFRVEQIDGQWWFVDPHGHLFLSTGSNCISSAGGRRRGGGGGSEPVPVERNLVAQRMSAWGFNTVGNWSQFRVSDDADRKVYVVTFRGPRAEPSYLGMPDVYSEDFARSADESAQRQCVSLRNDPWLLGYFIGNEPPWPEREGEVVDMFLNGPDSATKTKLRAFLADGDTPERRVQFVYGMFERYLSVIGAAIKRHDPNHLNLGIRFGGSPPEGVMRMGKIFDVCSINVYEYEPTAQLKRVYAATGRPIMIGEFHFGVPAEGLGAGLVQTADQIERGKGYRYYVEQAAALPGFLGAHWFQWSDEPVLGRFDGENYNIGLVDNTNRPYVELIEAAKLTHKRLHDVHAGKVPPFSERPKASAAGTPGSPWN